MSAQLEAAFAAIDAANAEDPDCLLYGRRMTAVLEELDPSPSDELAIAARAQHVRRFEVPRASYPLGLVGYKKWRAALGRFHAQLAARLARQVGYTEQQCVRIAAIVGKKNRRGDAATQTLEDVACLVFFRYHAIDFAAAHPAEKVASIVGKTVAKMSHRARQLAFESAPNPALAELIQEATTAHS